MNRKEYKRIINELIKIIKFRIKTKSGYIDLHEYCKFYKLSKSSILSEFQKKGLLRKIENYNRGIV